MGAKLRKNVQNSLLIIHILLFVKIGKCFKSYFKGLFLMNNAKKAFIEYQVLKEKTKKIMKKSQEKLLVIRKIVVPLQRFNKQLIVLQVLKAQKK